MRLTLMLLVTMLLPNGFVRSHTCLLAAFMNGRIVIAADSRSMDPRPGRTAETVCKLIRTRSFVFGNSGLAYVADVNFDVVANALAASRGEGDLAAQVSAFEQRTRVDLQRAVEHLRDRERVAYDFMLREDTALSTVIAGLSPNGQPLLANSQFRWRNDRIEVTRPDSPEGTLLALGRATAVFSYLQQTPRFFAARTLEQALTTLVQRQAAATPNEVAEPVDVASIDAFGVRWTARKAQCDDLSR